MEGVKRQIWSVAVRASVDNDHYMNRDSPFLRGRREHVSGQRAGLLNQP